MSPKRTRLADLLAPRAAYAYIRCLRATMRLEYRNREVIDQLRSSAGSYIAVFWHSRFAMMRYAFPGDRVVSLSSRHRDSQLLAAVTRRLGVVQAWGSSSDRGSSGLRQILRRIEQGYDVAWTPDGPRGPRRRVQAGVIAAARLSGKPIVAQAFSARPSRRLGSWDRTLLPFPLGRGLYLYGKVFEIPRRADAAEQERLRLALEAELDRVTDQADNEVGIPVEEPRPEIVR